MKPIRLALLGLVGLLPVVAHAAELRKVTNLKGDFAMIGNTLGHSCGAGTPVAGTVTSCTQLRADATPNLHWRAEDTTAVANPQVMTANARSTAMLQMPAGVQVAQAYLYWFAAAKEGDNQVTIERPGGAAIDVQAIKVHTMDRTEPDARLENRNLVYYLGVADVTAFVQQNANGAYRVSGVNSVELNDNLYLAQTGWTLVVFYQSPTGHPHNLALFDGIDFVIGPTAVAEVTLSGFTVPQAFDGKLGVVGIDGETAGGAFRFGPGPTLTAANNLSDAMNPENYFFNNTRSTLGVAVSVVGDLPQMNGRANSGSGIDMDIVDISSRLTAGQTEAKAVLAPAANDGIGILVWVTSISTFAPDFLNLTKTAEVIGGGPTTAGSLVQFAITATNQGNDTAINTVLSDPLPTELIYEPGSLRLVSGATESALTDAAGDDQGEYDPASRRVIVRLGTGASAMQGGSVAVGGAISVKFNTRVANAAAPGVVFNQAELEAGGLMGAVATKFLSDGVLAEAGTQPTPVVVMAMPDAGAPSPDAAASIPDAGTPTVADASVDSGGSAMGPGTGLAPSPDSDCGCRLGGQPNGTRLPVLACALFGLLVIRRRTRRK